MEKRNQKNSFILVIDTNSYAGNFERQLCAYVTGQTEEESRYSQIGIYAKLEINDNTWWSNNIKHELNDDGYSSPCQIYPSFDYDESLNLHADYTSVAIFVQEMPSDIILKEFIHRAKTFCANPSLIYKESGDDHSLKFHTNDSIDFIGIRVVERQLITITNTKKIKF